MKGIIIFILVICPLLGDQLRVLESFPAGTPDHFARYNDEYGIRVSSEGEILVLYTIIREDYRPHHFVKRYTDGPAELPIEIGHIGQYLTRGNPKISNYGEHFLELQVQTYADYYSSYELMGVDFDQPDTLQRQFVGFTSHPSLWQTWRSDALHASSFGTRYSYQGETQSHQFMSNYQLFDAPWDADTSYVMDPDTSFVVDLPLVWTFTKLKGSNIFAYLYYTEDNDYVSFACLDNDSIILQIDSVLSEVPREYELIASQNEFILLYNYDDSNNIDLWSFNPLTGEVTRNIAYQPGPEHFEVVYNFAAAIAENTLYIQLPSKQADTEPWVTIVTGMVRKQITYPGLNLIQTDTIVTLDGSPELLYHHITTKDDEAHSLLAMQTPDAATLLYYGPNAPLGIGSFEDVGNYIPAHKIKNIYPNPANPSTTITYQLSSRRPVKISIYSLTGRRVWEREFNHQAAGEHAVIWSGMNGHDQSVASGIYFVQITADQWRESRKIVVLR